MRVPFPIKVLAIMAVIVILVVGATRNVFNAMYGGQFFSHDNPEFWEIGKAAFDSHIAKEANGEEVVSRQESWEVFWATTIGAIKEHDQDVERQIEYIVEARKRAGLPDLPPEVFE